MRTGQDQIASTANPAFRALALETATAGNLFGCGLSLFKSEISRLRQFPASTSLKSASLSRDRVQDVSLNGRCRPKRPKGGLHLAYQEHSLPRSHSGIGGFRTHKNDEPIAILSGQRLYDSHCHAERPSQGLIRETGLRSIFAQTDAETTEAVFNLSDKLIQACALVEVGVLLSTHESNTKKAYKLRGRPE
jgi:hypothetical protein